jgi:2-phospho-L-lactate/phosphoenolpyruvate guanylyltransferase
MNRNKGLHVLVPHRGLYAGKSRLSAVLNDDARGELNRWLLGRTLRLACEWLGASQRCVVVSPCVHALQLAREAGVMVLREQAPALGLNGALTQGAVHAAALGAKRLLILHGDLPRADVAALQAMAALSTSGADTVIAPDRHGAGTNAMLVHAHVRQFAFGANSFAHHMALAKARGERVATCAKVALSFDLDTAEDLAEWVRGGDALPPFLLASPLSA